MTQVNSASVIPGYVNRVLSCLPWRIHLSCMVTLRDPILQLTPWGQIFERS